ncbi:MAG: phage terminase large subunit [Gemmatimonadaceae bacterium]|nr:phage terminase large subunit [Gemmatimonadaceae bacterium]
MLLYRGAIASGKTVAGGVRMLMRRLKYPGTVGIIGGPSWDQLRDGTMRTLRRQMHESWIAYENKVEHHWVLTNGSEMIFRTLADPDVLRALEAHDLWVDENAMCSPEVLDVGLGRLRLPYPQDPTFKHSWWGTTTPRAMDWTLGVFGEQGKDGYGVVHSTIYDNRANLPLGYIERLEEKYKGTPFFEQELLGLYTAFEGLVYPMFRREKHVRRPDWMLSDSDRIVVGVDFGGTADPSAMTLIGERHNRQHQFAEFYKVGATLDDMLARLAEWTVLTKRSAKQITVVCDPSGTVLTPTIGARGYTAKPAERDKLAGLKLTAQRLTGLGGVPQFTVSPECVYTIIEFGQYVWSKKREGETGVVYFTKVPIDHHADALDCDRYALMELGTTAEYKPVRLPGGRMVMGR